MYACGLVLWELMSRCTFDGEHPIGEYRLPFEDEIGAHPSLEDMQAVVSQQKKRPILLDSWMKHSAMSVIANTVQECWDQDAEARISASTICERIESLINAWVCRFNVIVIVYWNSVTNSVFFEFIFLVVQQVKRNHYWSVAFVHITSEKNHVADLKSKHRKHIFLISYFQLTEQLRNIINIYNSDSYWKIDLMSPFFNRHIHRLLQLLLHSYIHHFHSYISNNCKANYSYVVLNLHRFFFGFVFLSNRFVFSMK